MTLFLKKNIHILLIPLISLVILLSWFHEGKIISNTTEEELSIYHTQKVAEDYSNFWYPPGIGQKGPFQYARFPAFFVLSQLEQIGIPAFLQQALLFWTLMVAGVVSMYILLKDCFKVSAYLSLIGSFFYLLNIFSMTQVWKRLLYHGIFAWAYLPLFIFLWIRWIDTRNKKWLFFFLLTQPFFAYAFSQPAFIISIWTPAGIFVLVKAWQTRLKINELFAIFLKALVGLILWCLVNIWWLYPMLTLGSTWTEQTGQTWESDLSSLNAVSKSFPFWEVLLLRQSWYLSSENDFGSFYQNPLIILISILIVCFVILAIVKLKKYPYRVFVLVLAFIGLFVSKGTNFPLGYSFFYLLFLAVPFSAAFRNSYEKFGIVWLLAYTILFTLGFSKFLSILKPNQRYLLGASTLFLILILVLPFWSGGLFPQKHRLNVPSYYDAANNYLNRQSRDRLFHIPFLRELENLKYSWGFEGGDPSLALFDLESITKKMKQPVFYRVGQLLPKFLNNEQFPKLLGMLGVGNVVLHKDSIYPAINLADTTKYIESWKGIQGKKEIGELVVYSLSKDIINPTIYPVASIASVHSIEEGLTKVISGELDIKSTIFITGDNPIILTGLQSIPKIIFNKISNDHYKLEVKQATNSFILVFNNTFDKSWQAKINNQVIDKHFVVNGFANGWLIEKNGDYAMDISLKVWPWD